MLLPPFCNDGERVCPGYGWQEAEPGHASIAEWSAMGQEVEFACRQGRLVFLAQEDLWPTPA